MKFLITLRFVSLLQFFIVPTQCKKFEALVVTRKKDTYVLAEPYISQRDPSWLIFKSNLLKLKMFYHLCPDPKLVQKKFPNKSLPRNERALYISKTAFNKTREKFICNKAIQPVIAKVKNVKNFYENWDNSMELYHIGFQVYTANIQKKEKPPTTSIQKCMNFFCFYSSRLKEKKEPEATPKIENQINQNQRVEQYQQTEETSYEDESSHAEDDTEAEDSRTDEAGYVAEVASNSSDGRSGELIQNVSRRRRRNQPVSRSQEQTHEIIKEETDEQDQHGSREPEQDQNQDSRAEPDQVLNQGQEQDEEQGLDLDTKMKYESMDQEYDLIPVVSLFFNSNKKQTIAAQYQLISTKVKHHKYNEVSFLNEKVTFLDLTYYDSFFDFKTQRTFFKSILGDNALTSKYLNLNKYFVELYLVPVADLLVPNWKPLSRFNVNVTPIWEELRRKWLQIEKFVRKVANNIGHLKITNGIAGILSLKNHNDEPKEMYRDEENDKIMLPNIYWKIIEYTNKNKNTDIGIIIVMHSNLFFEPSEKICDSDTCPTNGWPISNSNFQTGQIYCCKMTTHSIENLKTNFIGLKPKDNFNLNLWNIPELKNLPT